MAEVHPGPAAARGRSTHRAGRGGHSSRGGGRPAPKNANGDPSASKQSSSLDEQGEIGQLKKKYLTELSTLKEMFPDWEDDDLVFGLHESDGDLQDTIERMTEGNVSRFAEIKKKSREKSRVKQPETTGTDYETRSGSTRGRGRGGADPLRSTRGRATDRGRGAARGGRGGSSAAINGGRSTAPPTTWDSGNSASDNTLNTATSNTWGDPSSGSNEWGDSGDADASKSSIIPQGTTKSWASIMAKPKVAPPATKAAADVASDPSQKVGVADPSTDVRESQEWDKLESQGRGGVGYAQDHNEGDLAHTPTLSTPAASHPAQDVPSSKDPLTENNLENVPDTSYPGTTETVASTRDPSSAVGSVTPYLAATRPQGQASRPPVGGYATTAGKAAGVPGRSGSFQRRMMSQQEAVVMPGKHPLDKATVQFGTMGLNSEEGANKPLDVDDDREDVETRGQPPQQSPSQPRASLPPAARQTTIASDPTHSEEIPTPKQAPGLPTPLQQQSGLGGASQLQQNLQGAPGLTQQGISGQPLSQYGRYGPGLVGQDPTAPLQKPQDPFSQQLNFASNQGEIPGAYGAQSQAQQPYGQHAHAATSHGQQNAASMGPSNDARNNFQNFYGGSYGGQTSMQENMPPQRSTSGFGPSDQGHTGAQVNQYSSRIAENHASGHNTPNPPLGAQAHHSQQMHHQGHNQSSQGSYPYANPYYGGSYYGAYMNQYPSQYGYGHQGYGGPYNGGKGGMYSQPQHGYAMSSQSNYDQLHPSSPSNTGFGGTSMGGRDAGVSGLNEFTRSGSTQPTQATHTNASAGFGMGDGYGRSGSGLAGHQGYGQPTSGANEESLKPLHDGKMGPSPSLGVGQQGRPGSAFNTGAPQSGNQSGYGPPQQGFSGGYPSHLGQLSNAPGSQYGGGFGGLGGQHGAAQGHQGGNYGGYGGFGNNYGNYGGRGWGGGSYGH